MARKFLLSPKVFSTYNYYLKSTFLQAVSFHQALHKIFLTFQCYPDDCNPDNIFLRQILLSVLQQTLQASHIRTVLRLPVPDIRAVKKRICADYNDTYQILHLALL